MPSEAITAPPRERLPATHSPAASSAAKYSGSADMAHDEHQLMASQVLSDMPERFTDGENYCWVEFKGGTHAYNCWLPHLYNCLRVFYK